MDDGALLKHTKIYSIIIRVRNAERDLKKCLNLLRQQLLPKGVELEVVVVDNESSDNSVLVAREYGAKVVFLPVAEFSWGRALNRGIAASSGEIILLLSADAHPANNSWVIEMAAPLNEPNVAVVYGRQIPRTDAPIDEMVRLRKYFPEINIKFNKQSLTNEESNIIASNACASFHRRIWETYSFDEIMSGAEERPWVCQVLSADFQILYCASAIVFHSHNDTFLRNACRLIELWEEACLKDSQQFDLKGFGKSILVYSKNRFLNIFFPQISIMKRLEGVVRLPLEITAMVFVFIALQTGKFKKMRSYVWK